MLGRIGGQDRDVLLGRGAGCRETPPNAFGGPTERCDGRDGDAARQREQPGGERGTATPDEQDGIDLQQGPAEGDLPVAGRIRRRQEHLRMSVPLGKRAIRAEAPTNQNRVFPGNSGFDIAGDDGPFDIARVAGENGDSASRGRQFPPHGPSRLQRGLTIAHLRLV